MADDKDVVEKTIAEDLVVTKYKMAGEIVNSELKYLEMYTFEISKIFCVTFFLLTFVIVETVSGHMERGSRWCKPHGLNFFAQNYYDIVKITLSFFYKEQIARSKLFQKAHIW